MMEDVFAAMKAKWKSAIVSRAEIGDFTGGAVSSKTLANADSAGVGPKERLKIGRLVAYPVDSLCDWLQARATQ